MKGAVAVNVTDGGNVVDIRNRIHVIRGVQVMLDRDLAALYQVEVKQLNRQVQRNIERFPADFMFQLNKEECSRCQIGTLNVGRGSNLKYLPYVFTEHGICMLSGLLRSSRAIEVNIAIMRALRGSGTTDRVATDRVIVAFCPERKNSNGTSAAISRCGVTAIGTAL